MLKVNELARQSGSPAHVVRYYARIGLIAAADQQENGYRLFAPGEAAKIRFIRMAKNLGFTLSEIRQIIQHADCGVSPCPDVRRIIQQHINDNRARIEAMTKLQERMERALAAWDRMPDGMPDGDHVCHLIESAQEDDAARPAGEKPRAT